MSNPTIVYTEHCPNCGNDGLLLMKRLDTAVLFAECENCRSGYWGPDLAHAFPTDDLYWERSGATLQEARTGGWTSLAVQGAMPEAGATPEPATVAAWFVLDRVALERVPWWAAEWLTQGYDGENLRYLAGEHGDDVLTIKDLLPSAFAEMQVVVPNSLRDAAAIAMDEIARLCRDGVISERDTTEFVSHIIAAADYADDLYELPLGRLYGWDDEWDAGFGRPKEVLQGEVRRACAAQLARG